MTTASGAAMPAQLDAGGVCGSKWTHTVLSVLAIRLQPFEPLHPPPQPTNVELASGCSVSETLAPLATVMLHVPGQSMPAGCDVTCPPPLPVKETVTSALPAGAGGGAWGAGVSDDDGGALDAGGEDDPGPHPTNTAMDSHPHPPILRMFPPSPPDPPT
jgi:hypothetical protein